MLSVPPVAGSLRAKFLSDVKRGAAANQSGGRGPVVHAQYDACDNRRDARDLHNFSDQN